LDLDDDVLEAARALAKMRNQTMGKVVSELVRQGLHQPPAKLKTGMASRYFPNAPVSW
jgi:hypothetical protein